MYPYAQFLVPPICKKYIRCMTTLSIYTCTKEKSILKSQSFSLMSILKTNISHHNSERYNLVRIQLLCFFIRFLTKGKSLKENFKVPGRDLKVIIRNFSIFAHWNSCIEDLKKNKNLQARRTAP